MYFTLLNLSGKDKNFIAPCDSTHLGGNTGIAGGSQGEYHKITGNVWVQPWVGLQRANKSAHWDGWEIENLLELYCIYYRTIPTLSDRQVWANCRPRSDCSVWSGSTLFAILSASFRRITLWKICVKFKGDYSNFLGVRIFRDFTVWYDMGQVMRKCVLCHMPTTKVQRRIHAVWSAPLLFAA